jgi:hypothetical protein
MGKVTPFPSLLDVEEVIAEKKELDLDTQTHLFMYVGKHSPA